MRENLAELHTAEAWKMKEGREVVAGELAKPAKEVKRRGYKPNGRDRPLDLEDDQVPSLGVILGPLLDAVHLLMPNYCCEITARPGGQPGATLGVVFVSLLSQIYC